MAFALEICVFGAYEHHLKSVWNHENTAFAMEICVFGAYEHHLKSS
jgi:hypothetical protein